MATDIKIEKNVPIPIRAGNKGSKYAHVVRKLEVGDSFWVPKDEVGKGFSASVRVIAKVLQIAVTTRTEFKDGIEGWRTWRIEKVNGTEQLKQAKGAVTK